MEKRKAEKQFNMAWHGSVMEHVFHKVDSRFHINNPNIYIILGIFPWDDSNGNQVMVWMDNEELETQTIVYKTPDIAVKYMYADSEITQEVHIQVTLPSHYETFKNMYYATVTNAGVILKKERIKITEILRQREWQYHELFGGSFADDCYVFYGCCTLLQPIQIKVFHDSEEIPHDIVWQTRAETRCYYPEYGFMPFSDYRIELQDREFENVVLEFKSGNQRLYKNINLKRFRKEAWYCSMAEQGIFYHFRYSIYHHWNDGSLMWICKKLLLGEKTIKSIIKPPVENYDIWMKERISTPKKKEVQNERLKSFAYVLQNYTILQGCQGIFGEDAEYEMAKAIVECPDIDVLYTDEDVFTPEGGYQDPIYKPDYAPDYLSSMNYIGNCYVIRTSLLQSILHDIDSELTIAKLQDGKINKYAYDILLRCQKKECVFYHVPRSLFHRREPKAPEEIRHIRYEWDEKPLVSILIPNKDHIQELDTCIRSIERLSSYRNYEYVIIENNSTAPQTFEYYKKIQEEIPKVKILYYKDEFNFARINNYGAKYAKGDYFLLLNNDTEIITPDSIWEMLSYAMRKDIGIVGARLYFPDNTIQHAGVIIGYGGVVGHAFLGADRAEPGYQNRIICPQNYSAVTAACLMVSRKIYEEVGGMSEEYKVAFNDIDFCLKVRERGYLIVYNPYAEFYHYESKSRGIDDTTEKMVRYQQEIQMFTERWKKILQAGDPYYNINLTLDKKDFSVNYKEIIDVSEK